MYTRAKTKNQFNTADHGKLQPQSSLGVTECDDCAPPQYVVIRFKSDSGNYESFVWWLGDTGVETGEVAYFNIPLSDDKIKELRGSFGKLPEEKYALITNDGKIEPDSYSSEGFVKNTWESLEMEKTQSDFTHYPNPESSNTVTEDLKKIDKFGKITKRNVTTTWGYDDNRNYGKTKNTELEFFTGGFISPPIDQISPIFKANQHEIPGGLKEGYEALKEQVRQVLIFSKTYGAKLTLLGHTDRAPTGIKGMDNKALSDKRAKAMKGFMMDKEVFNELALSESDFVLVEGRGDERAKLLVEGEKSGFKEVIDKNNEDLNKIYGNIDAHIKDEKEREAKKKRENNSKVAELLTGIEDSEKKIEDLDTNLSNSKHRTITVTYH